jgi:hypothetical protein
MKGLALATGRRARRRTGERGGALLVALVAVVVLGGLSSAILALSMSSAQEQRTGQSSIKVLYGAEAGVSHAMTNIAADQLASFGPVAFGGGNYTVTITPNEDEDAFTVLSTGDATGSQRTIEAIIARNGGDIFSHALFAGNSSDDPNYTLTFSGQGDQGDSITGDVYSGGHAEVLEDAEINGNLRATGTVAGAPGEEGVSQPIPDIQGMDYANNNDVDVLAEFNSGAAQSRSRAAGGTAMELPEDYRSHIFRLNPSDRRSNYQSTVKEDFFLEDPHEPINSDGSQDGSNPTNVTISGGGEPGPNGNELVYFIDGNLWLHNRHTYSLRLTQPGSNRPLRITFIVRGNIYFSDNFFLEDSQEDGVAFIAIRDERYLDDSGNIYFGDPTFGTLRHMSAFMYAENNFYDYNLGDEGSATVEVNGNMTAGNQVLITRDYEDSHSKLTVNHDDRIMTGQITLPGLPRTEGGIDELMVVSWREVPNP